MSETIKPTNETPTTPNHFATLADCPPYEEHIQNLETRNDATAHETTHYLETIDDARRNELITVSAELTEAIPEAVIMGGNALRILYEAKTGHRMFGVGKNDHDIYVPRANIDKYIADGQIGGFPLDMEKTETGALKWIKPAEGNLVITPPYNGDHIDVFGRDDETIGTPEIVELDGQALRVQSLTDQIRDKVDLMLRTDGLDAFDLDDPEHNRKAQDKYGYYAQKLLEIVDATPDEIDETKLPDGWKSALEVMASKGQFGQPLANESSVSQYEALQRQWAEKQAKIQTLKAELVDELKAYYEHSRQNPSEAHLTGHTADLLSDHTDAVAAALHSAPTANDFISSLLNNLTTSGAMDEIAQAISKLAE